MPKSSTTAKLRQLSALAQQRQQTQWTGVTQVGHYHNGYYDSEHVSPYTRSAGNVDADVFLMLQDWSSRTWLLKHPNDSEVRRLGYSPRVRTNRNLIDLLRTHLGLPLADTYATNLFPFIKEGGLSATVQEAQLLQAAESFALPQVRIVRPKLVVCLGQATDRALRSVCGQRPMPDLASAIANPFDHAGVRYWAQAHPGYFGQLNRNRADPKQVAKDWCRMSDWLSSVSTDR